MNSTLKTNFCEFFYVKAFSYLKKLVKKPTVDCCSSLLQISIQFSFKKYSKTQLSTFLLLQQIKETLQQNLFVVNFLKSSFINIRNDIILVSLCLCYFAFKEESHFVSSFPLDCEKSYEFLFCSRKFIFSAVESFEQRFLSRLIGWLRGLFV